MIALKPLASRAAERCSVNTDKDRRACAKCVAWRILRRARGGLDASGFTATKIHMHNPPTSKGGLTAAKAFREDPAVWKTIDYAALNLYDYQSSFHDPDGFDASLGHLRDAAGDKPFLAVEVCVNNGEFETPAYRVALAMGQIYYKLLTRLNACRVMYCWTWFNRLKGGPARCLCPTRSMASNQ